MKKGLFRNIFTIALAGITVFSAVKYALSLKEKYALLNTLNQVRGQVNALENDKQGLSKELEKEKESNAGLNTEVLKMRGHLEASKVRLAKLFVDVDRAEKNIEDLNAKFSILKSENILLRDENEKMGSRVTGLSQENQGLKTKLSSVSELKKAIRELKRRTPQLTLKDKVKQLIEGNRGFLIKDGRLTSAAKIKIEVTPGP